MALKKKIKSQNGVELEYHRIAMITNEVNQKTTILVRSYINEKGREYEKAYENGEISGEITLPYMVGNYFHTEYNGAMSIGLAYDWIKKCVPEFEGAEDTEDESDEITGDEFISMIEEVL